jgi:hypothetical protein
VRLSSPASSSCSRSPSPSRARRALRCFARRSFSRSRKPFSWRSSRAARLAEETSFKRSRTSFSFSSSVSSFSCPWPETREDQMTGIMKTSQTPIESPVRLGLPPIDSPH